MKIRYTPKFLTDLENIFEHAGYPVRYEKGNFQAGYCVLHKKRIIVVNRYFALEGKVNTLLELLKTVDWSFENLPEKSKELYEFIKNETIEVE
jgi:hypothetical protein